MEKLFLTANFSRNPAHRERLRRRLFGADDDRRDGELSEDLLKEASGGTGGVLNDAPMTFHEE